MRILVFLMVVVCFAFADERYVPGQGLKLDDVPVYLGGYLSAVGEAQGKKKQIVVDELALMLYGDFMRSGFMSEFEIKDFYTKSFNEKYENEHVNTKIHIERLYYSYDIDDESEIVIGKFLTQAGFWNVLPINVLRDTTSDPNFIESIFPEMSTGLEYKHYFDTTTLYCTLQHNHGIDDQYNNFSLKHHYAVALAWNAEDSVVKASIGEFAQRNDGDSVYSTLGYMKESSLWKFMIEAGVRKTDSFHKLMYDVYMQNLWHLHVCHDLILRVERFRDRTQSRSDAVFGYTYRPVPYMAFKGELDVSDHGYGKVLCSFSIMF